MAVPLLLFLVALCVRALTTSLFGDPAYPDSFYYVNLAHQLAAGHGFSIDFIWNFVEVGGRLPDAAAAVLPIPSDAHWMPLAALIQVPFIWVLGPTVLASALPFWLCAAAVAPVTWLIARDAGLTRGQAIAGGLLAAVPGAVTPYLAQPDNFALFMLLGAISLWACSRGLRGDRRAFALGGIAVGLATLSRNDGVLLGVPFALAFVLDLVRRPRAYRIGWVPAIACAAGFLIVVSPWYLRQLAVFGSLSPSAANGRILFITDYRQLYSVSDHPTLQTFLGQGLGPLLSSRVAGLASALTIFATMPLAGFLTPFMLLGGWLRRRDPNFSPWTVYAVTLLAFNALLFAVHVPYGTFLHSAVALLPHAYLVALIGVAATVRWVARHRSNWNAERATGIFTAMAVAVTMVVAGFGTLLIVRNWRAEQDVREQVAAMLAQLDVPVADRLMSPDAGAYRYLAGRGGVVTPNDPLPVVADALREYQIRWLVLESSNITSDLEPLLAGTERPDWLSAPALTIPAALSPEGADGISLASQGGASPGSLPRAALYAVCFDVNDTRCTP
jgi:4-amino-4-deoxy-L-arabinose transferase-like glycosyltransferase